MSRPQSPAVASTSRVRRPTHSRDEGHLRAQRRTVAPYLRHCWHQFVDIRTVASRVVKQPVKPSYTAIPGAIPRILNTPNRVIHTYLWTTGFAVPNSRRTMPDMESKACSDEPVLLRDCFVELLTELAGRENNDDALEG